METAPKSICLIRISSLGDVLLISPLLRQLRRRFPAARIDAITGERLADALRHNPRLTSLIELDTTAGIAGIISAKQEALRQIPGGRYAAVIDVQRSPRSAALRFGLGRVAGKLDKRRLQKIALVQWKRGIGAPTVPVALRYLDAARRLGAADDGEGLELWLPEERGAGEYPPARRIFGTIGAIAHERAPRIVFAPGARHFTKRWPAQKFAALGTLLRGRYGAEITLVGSADDAGVCGEIAAMLPFPVENLAGRADIFDSARALDRSDAAITNDSAAMHIAAARRVPVVAVFGSTVRELGFAPFRVPFAIAEADVECRPCSHIGRASCPAGHFRCMTGVMPERVAGLLAALSG